MLGFALLIFAGAPRAGETPKPEEISIDAPHVVVKGVRYRNPGKPPVLLVHGVMNNTASFDPIAKQLYEKGFDVWSINLRWHGNGDHQTLVKNYHPGDYGVKFMAAEDIPAAVDYVFEQTGQKLTLFGFSMGAMTSDAYAAGATIGPNGKLMIDPAVGEKRVAKLAKLIKLGGPTNFRHMKLQYKAAGTALKPLSGNLHVGIPTKLTLRAPTTPPKSPAMDKVSESLVAAGSPIFSFFTPSGILNSKNVSRKNRVHFFRQGLSSLHMDTAGDFGGWASTGEYAIDGVSLENVRAKGVPTLVVMGTKDEFATVRMGQESVLQFPPGQAELVTVEGAGHIDLSIGDQVVTDVTDTATAFIRDEPFPRELFARPPTKAAAPDLQRPAKPKYKFGEKTTQFFRNVGNGISCLGRHLNSLLTAH